MPEFKKDFKSLYTAYDNQLQKQNKAELENFGLDHFITYLKFMRDYYILTEPLISEDGTENIKIATLATAITTYDKYQVCVSLCKTIKNNTQENEALLNKYTKEKEFQWHTCWNLIRLNMETWCNA